MLYSHDSHDGRGNTPSRTDSTQSQECHSPEVGYLSLYHERQEDPNIGSLRMPEEIAVLMIEEPNVAASKPAMHRTKMADWYIHDLHRYAKCFDLAYWHYGTQDDGDRTGARRVMDISVFVA